MAEKRAVDSVLLWAFMGFSTFMGFIANSINNDCKYKCNTSLLLFFIAVAKCQFFFKGRIRF